MTANFSTPDDDVISRKLSVHQDQRVPKELLDKHYEITECVKWIQGSQFKKVS